MVYGSMEHDTVYCSLVLIRTEVTWSRNSWSFNKNSGPLYWGGWNNLTYWSICSLFFPSSAYFGTNYYFNVNLFYVCQTTYITWIFVVVVILIGKVYVHVQIMHITFVTWFWTLMGQHHFQCFCDDGIHVSFIKNIDPGFWALDW